MIVTISQPFHHAPSEKTLERRVGRGGHTMFWIVDCWGWLELIRDQGVWDHVYEVRIELGT
jgi:hypothetical protein